MVLCQTATVGWACTACEALRWVSANESWREGGKELVVDEGKEGGTAWEF